MLCDKILVFIFFVTTERVNCKYTTGDYLDSLDYVISRHINEPTEKASERLFEDLDKYLDTLENLLECLKAKDQSMQEAIASYWALGKPGFTQDYDLEVYKTMQRVLCYTDEQMGVFFDKIEEVKSIWEEFKDECEKDVVVCLKLEDYMMKIDNFIVKQLLSPKKKFSDDILPNINLYNLNLYNIVKAFRMQKPITSQIVETLCKRGMTKFVTRRNDFNDSVIQKIFEWEDYHMYHLNYTIETTEKLRKRLDFWYSANLTVLNQ